MTTIEYLMNQPHVGHQVVRKIISIPAGTSDSIKVNVDGKDYTIKATILKAK